MHVERGKMFELFLVLGFNAYIFCGRSWLFFIMYVLFFKNCGAISFPITLLLLGWLVVDVKKRVPMDDIKHTTHTHN
jgi:hypothetical protein